MQSAIPLHAREKAYADRSRLHDEITSLPKQNDVKRMRQSAKSRVISQGNAKIMSYSDVVEAQWKRIVEADKSPRNPSDDGIL